MSNILDLWRGGIASPMRELNQFQRTIDRLYDEWAGTKMKGDLQNFAFNPNCEVSETKNAYTLKFDMPGMSKDQIKIELHENQLTVSGERKEEKREEDPGSLGSSGSKDKKRHFSEVYYGAFMRMFTFPTPVDSERVEAKYENGVLSVNVLKTEQSKTRQVTIK